MERLKLTGNKRTVLIALSVAFIAVETAIYVCIHTSSGRGFARSAFASIVLAFCFSFLPLVIPNRDGTLIRLGMLFTVVADFFLVFLDPVNELAGVLVFSLVQFCYFAYIFKRHSKNKQRIIHLSVRAAITLILLIMPPIVLGDGADALVYCSVFYYGQLLCNLLFALLDGRLKLFAVGLFLFAMCDLSIGLNEMAGTYLGAEPGTFLYALNHTGINLAWVFYLPSQTLIPLSLMRFNRGNKI